jgi:hypothetical protein
MNSGVNRSHREPETPESSRAAFNNAFIQDREDKADGMKIPLKLDLSQGYEMS